jgi:hypothetical protein
LAVLVQVCLGSGLPAIAAATTATTATTAATTTAFAVVAAATTTAVVTAAAAAITTTATTVATTAAAIATTAAATAATAVSTTAAAESSTGAALLALLGFIDAKRPTVEGAAVHAFDRLGGFLGSSHGYEREPAGTAGLAIRDQMDIAYGSELLERGTDAFSIGIEREVSNVQTSIHRLLDLAQVTTVPPRRGPCVLQSGGFNDERRFNSH